MSYKSLTHFISALESAGELIRIKEPVSPELEITEIADRMVKHGGPALLFENTGTAFPLLINAYASDRRICLALGVQDLDEVGEEIGRLTSGFLGPKERFVDKLKLLPALQEISSRMPKVVRRKGACQEVVMDPPDLTRLPVLKCWPADGGQFITLPCVHTRDPENGIRNLGMYRMQIFGPDLTGMHWHLHKGSAAHFNKYRELGKRMPVTVTLGGDPAYTYAATAPLPENIDEYMFAGFLRKKRVEMVRCLTNDLEVPSDVDFVIEGYVDPQEEFILEGPFGDHTGFYSLADHFPKFHVTCITHRREAVYPATIVGIPPMEDGWIGKATEKIFRAPIRMTVAPELGEMHMPAEGVFHNIVLATIRKTYPGQALKVMNSLWGAGQMMFNKFLFILDQGTDLSDYKNVARIISAKAEPARDIHLIRGPLDILDHSAPRYAFGSKAGFDATEKLREEQAGGGHSPEPFCDCSEILSEFPEIKNINASLPDEGISLVVLSVIKNRKHQVRQTGISILERGFIRNVKFLLFIDSPADVADLPSVAWLAAGNTDPLRDMLTVPVENDPPFTAMVIDATKKSKKLDDFERPWPNVIVMADDILARVDAKWDKYGLGKFVTSPSLRFKSLKINDQAYIS
jgi:4-hydroxy-3-polyprenylbenzoate decarboxylase